MTRNVSDIIELCEGIEFWRKAQGWAPAGAAELLAGARLDRQSSFARTLHDALEPFPPLEAEARQIIGYATLRSLIEGTLKLFLAVYLVDYMKDPDAFRDRKGNIIRPEKLPLQSLITFYEKRVDKGFNVFLRRVQTRGNAIHHFADRDIGTQEDLKGDITIFRLFLLSVNDRLPYPDEMCDPRGRLGPY